MADALRTFATRNTTTPQSERADKRQVQNAAGGYVFQVSQEEYLRRFLTLGTDGGTYYASARDLTRDAANGVIAMIETNEYSHVQVVNTILEISTQGRAPKQNPALFALALAASFGSAEGRAYALQALPKVARTGTHLFLFAGYVEQFRGWGRGLKRAVSDWYIDRDTDALAYQAVKYRQREGWTHRDLLRLAHPKTVEDSRKRVFEWIVRGTTDGDLPEVIEAYLKAQEPGVDYVGLINRYPALSWEMLPDQALNMPSVWEALIVNGIPQTALMRQLPRLTRLGVLAPMSPLTDTVAARLTDPERLKKARVHPVNVLLAHLTYAEGRSQRGDSTWKPVTKITDALDAAFYAAYGAIEPAGKRTLLALDVSGSMGMARISNMPITPRDASAALSLVTAATEPYTMTVGFTAGRGAGRWDRTNALTVLDISPRQRLKDAIRTVSDLPFGGTDCALPMVWAKEAKMEIDTFVVLTDNETWAGRTHPHEALEAYRQSSGIPAKCVVLGMTATGCSIANPSDPGMLDIAGFDSAVPTLLADFSRGL